MIDTLCFRKVQMNKTIIYLLLRILMNILKLNLLDQLTVDDIFEEIWTSSKDKKTIVMKEMIAIPYFPCRLSLVKK